MKDVCPVHGKNNTVSDHVIPLDHVDNEASLMVYVAAEENSSASNAPGSLRQDEFSDTSEDSYKGN